MMESDRALDRWADALAALLADWWRAQAPQETQQPRAVTAGKLTTARGLDESSPRKRRAVSRSA